MNLIKLEIIVLLAQHQKVTAVADLLGLKQPTITFHMKSLEKEYGVQLFVFRAGKVLLTDAGEALRHYAAKIHALSQESDRVLREYRELKRGVLTIGASYVPGTYVLPAIIKQFSQQNAGITVHMTIKPAPVITRMLRDHSVDIGLISSLPFEDTSIKQHQICADELVLIVPNNHRLADEQPLIIEELSNETFILHEQDSSTRQMTEQWAADQGIRLQTRMELDSLEAIKKSVMLGMGISLISYISVEGELARGELQVIRLPQPPAARVIIAGYHKERWLSASMRSFLHVLEQMHPISQGLR